MSFYWHYVSSFRPRRLNAVSKVRRFIEITNFYFGCMQVVTVHFLSFTLKCLNVTIWDPNRRLTPWPRSTASVWQPVRNWPSRRTTMRIWPYLRWLSLEAPFGWESRISLGNVNGYICPIKRHWVTKVGNRVNLIMTIESKMQPERYINSITYSYSLVRNLIVEL